MEDTLRVDDERIVKVITNSLNPCCNGRYSQSVIVGSEDKPKSVLILVVMEDTLRVPKQWGARIV